MEQKHIEKDERWNFSIWGELIIFGFEIQVYNDLTTSEACFLKIIREYFNNLIKLLHV